LLFDGLWLSLFRNKLVFINRFVTARCGLHGCADPAYPDFAKLEGVEVFRKVTDPSVKFTAGQFRKQAQEIRPAELAPQTNRYCSD